MFITSSSLDCFKSCRAKYKLRYVDCIVPKQTSNALFFGSAMHTALERYFNNIPVVQAMGGEITAEEVTEGLFADDKFERAKLFGLMQGYINHWLVTDTEDYNVVAVEREFSHRIENHRISVIDGEVKIFDVDFSGKIDGILERKSDGKIFILEHKTASIVDDDYINQKSIDSQTLTYAVMVQETLEKEVSGVIHDIIIKQKIRIKKGESEDEFCQRLIDDVSDENFKRIQIEFTQEYLNDFKEELMESCRVLSSCRKYFKSTCNCIGRYGACEYLPICKAGGLTPDIADMYEQRRAHEELSLQNGGDGNDKV